MAEPYATPTQRYLFISDDPGCPYCRLEGRRQPNCCKRHRWAYSNWLGSQQRVISGLEAPNPRRRRGPRTTTS